ncbi:MAG: FmdB family zinc ribbon protein [Fimbriiglobus sp.]
MPLYLYEEILEDDSGGEQFELFQSMSAKPYTEHPDTGVPVRRIFGVPNAPKTWTDTQGKAKTSDGNLERLGFTKYVKGGSGKYEKRFGKGPDVVKKPPSE